MEHDASFQTDYMLQQLIHLRKKIEEDLFDFSSKQKTDMSEASRQNLAAFLALHKYSDQALPSRLTEEGFSSLQMMTPHVLHSLNSIISHLSSEQLQYDSTLDVKTAKLIQNRRNKTLLGKDENNPISVMVTLDKKMLEAPDIFEELLQAGMTIARINLARDYSVWKELVDQIRFTEKKIGCKDKCKIYMDLPGPKIRATDFQRKSMSPVGYSKKQHSIKVGKGDLVRIFKSSDYLSKPGMRGEPASIGVTVPCALKNVKPKDRVFFDDGKISATVLRVTDEYLEIKITFTKRKKESIKPHKGINFPDSEVHLYVEAITEQDIDILPEIVPVADLIGISFIHQPKDIQTLKIQLDQYTERTIGVIAKIETKQAVLSLPEIIYEGLNLDSFGVMIARGDLAVEIGYEKLAKAQGDILEICRAAHVPVIWATTVLDRMNKKGIPLRAEVTDAFMGLTADCIMLNKGPYVSRSLQLLKQLTDMNKNPLLELDFDLEP